MTTMNPIQGGAFPPSSAPAAPVGAETGIVRSASAHDETQPLPAWIDQLDELLRGPGGAVRGVPEPMDAEAASPGEMDPALADAENQLSTDMGALMALFAKLAQESRNTARLQRQAELSLQVGALKDAADEMRSAAESRFAAALVQGIAQIGSGVISIASAVKTLKQIVPPKDLTTDLPELDAPPPKDLAPGSYLSTKLQAEQSLANGLSQLVQASGTLIGSGIELDASMADAQGKQLEAEGAQAQADRDAAQEAMQTMADILRDIREQVRAIAQSDIETNRGMARNI